MESLAFWRPVPWDPLALQPVLDTSSWNRNIHMSSSMHSHQQVIGQSTGNRFTPCARARACARPRRRFYLRKTRTATPTAGSDAAASWIQGRLQAWPAGRLAGWPAGCLACLWLPDLPLAAWPAFGCLARFWLPGPPSAAWPAFGCLACLWLPGLHGCPAGCLGCLACLWLPG